ncbi:FtsK/SpoIIIE domain-containing protein [Flavitalea sp. BT771]|uniref:FtsK/SpoIIIE domain-containing protein n=1 Tax=Flavitalea sp. BT771 TaxID=3063329 RepID=UPI0026E16AB5|nr:FtsK/SpoIIIE domain-containing protein [Flavitalea sp. BT771]MDO6432773.1 FtsK/SpoIIIE domain-containing protein [Flavitalea sp. BT771]MDV6221951.1 FtsK/SpoIIIE domain-containing protein [Flavitalea sp. BT771]
MLILLKTNYIIRCAIGKKIDNENFIVDLASMPHLLMAGATGQGKSVGLNALCIEMDNRYDLLKEANVRNIKEYNEKFIKRRLSPQKGHQYLPFMMLVVDEFADLIMTAGKEVEMPIVRLAASAREVGIHLIIATNRPSPEILTRNVGRNFPARASFKVAFEEDSMAILNDGGAEKLEGSGDMLISYDGAITRVQCAFPNTSEVEAITQFIGEQRGYPEAYKLPEYVDEKEAEARELDLVDRDPSFEEAASLIVQNQLGSTSLLQRRMQLGYNRAGRLMDQLDAAGVVGPGMGGKPRNVLIKSEIELEQYLHP